jgi:hypothetical protein
MTMQAIKSTITIIFTSVISWSIFGKVIEISLYHKLYYRSSLTIF